MFLSRHYLFTLFTLLSIAIHASAYNQVETRNIAKAYRQLNDLDDAVKHINLLGDDWGRWIWASVFILIGIPMCFFGLKYFRWFAFCFGFIGGQFLGQTIKNKVLAGSIDEDDKWWWAIIFNVCAVIIGILFGLLCICLAKCAFIIPGGYGGFFVAILLIGLINQFIDDEGGLQWYWSLTIIISFIIAGLVVAWQLAEFFIVVVTAIHGANLTFQGIGSMTGQYPRRNNNTAAWIPWIYFAIMVCMAVGGFIVQMYYYRKVKSEKEGEKEIEVDDDNVVEVKINVQRGVREE